MKVLRYISNALFVIALAACSADEFTPPAAPVPAADDDNSIRISLFMPDRATVASRAFGDKPDYNDLHLYVVEFDLNGDPLDNSLSNVYLAEDETPTPAAAPDSVVFKLTPTQTMSPKVLHLIAVPVDVELKFGEYGSEGYIIPSLATLGGDEAYWQRIEFPNGYGTREKGADDKETWTILPEAHQKLRMVPMIRNFAKVTVQKDNSVGHDSSLDNFVLEGYALLNVPSAGTVAPWNSTSMTFPTFVNASKVQIDYKDLNYRGILAGDIQQQDATAASFTNEPKYLYERPYSSVDHTQLLIKGNFNNEGSTYYKIDLGQQNFNEGRFDFFNLIRNFNYVITIKSVGTSGYATPAEAENGVVYNNLSFDLDTQKMLNISNGSDMLWVNFTTAVISQDTETDRTLKFRFRYKSGIANNGGTVANSADYVKNLKAGDVIESVTGPVVDGEWMEYTIKTKAPDAETKYQSFVVVNSATGLGRTINLILRDPWEVTDVYEAAGNYNSPPFNVPTDSLGTASPLPKQPLTIFFTIPENLPEAIFPLSFTMESNMQNIENNPVGSLVVTSGSSFFPNVTGRRIKYIKTVTWSDYNNLLNDDNPSGTIVYRNSTESYHQIRCRFRTITSLGSLGVDEATTTVRINNPYFTTPLVAGSDTERVNDGKIEVQFTRSVN